MTSYLLWRPFGCFFFFPRSFCFSVFSGFLFLLFFFRVGVGVVLAVGFAKLEFEEFFFLERMVGVSALLMLGL